MSIEIRPASEGDLETLVELNGAVQRLHAELEPAHFKGACRKVLAFTAH